MPGDSFELIGPDGRTIDGYLLAVARAPAVIVLHEIFGLNEQIKGVVRRLVNQGFTAMALDLYSGRTTTDIATGFGLAQQVDWKAAVARIRTATHSLSEFGEGAKVGILGFSLGGGVALAAASYIPQLSACATFYGLPGAGQADITRIQCKIQGHFASIDRHVPEERVSQLEERLAQFGIPSEIFRYEAAHHFFNEVRQDTHSAYNAQLAWYRLIQYLQSELS